MKIKDIFNNLRPSITKKLCYLSAMLGYKYTSDWIINNVPEAAYLIGDYLKNHPDGKDEMMDEYFQNADHIYEKAFNKYKQLKFLEKKGFEPKELGMMEGD